MRRYFIATLGCKLNQFDSAHAEGLLRRGDCAPTDDPAEADVILLNTCTVTMKADADGRRLARRFRRLNPRARIVATGCYAEREPEALESLGVLDGVVGLSERASLGSALLGEEACTTEPLELHFGDRSRAFLRVQEGCDLSCSYCIIPQVRGPSRSVDATAIRADLAALAGRGVREVGLTGINTGAWGADLSPRRELSDLVEELLDEMVRLGVSLRIRLGSLEPRTITGRLLELMRHAPERIVPHIQIPLQSGSDRVLARMNRNYRTRHYREVVERVVTVLPDACLGADVITGFPGEEDVDHRATLALIDGLPLAYLHVFSYSPRPGTRAAGLGGRVPERIAGERTRELRRLGQRKARAFRERALGTVREALGLHATADDGRVRALTDNYIEVLVDEAPGGEIFPLRLVNLAPRGLEVSGCVAR